MLSEFLDEVLGTNDDARASASEFNDAHLIGSVVENDFAQEGDVDAVEFGEAQAVQVECKHGKLDVEVAGAEREGWAQRLLEFGDRSRCAYRLRDVVDLHRRDGERERVDRVLLG